MVREKRGKVVVKFVHNIRFGGNVEYALFYEIQASQVLWGLINILRGEKELCF